MPKSATSEPLSPATIASLLEKGDGVLVRRGGVWTYPSAPNDRSGTNLVLPIEFVSDATVQEAIGKGDLAARVTDANGVATSVGKPVQDGTPIRVVDLMRAGSVEAATELPPNSRPTHDAGRDDRTVDVAKAQMIVEAQKPAAPALGSSTGAAPAVAGPALAPNPTPATKP